MTKITALSREEFLAQLAIDLNSSISKAQQSGRRLVKAFVCDPENCSRSVLEILVGAAPKPENMPVESQWSMSYLLNLGYRFEVDICDLHLTDMKWGILVEVPTVSL